MRDSDSIPPRAGNEVTHVTMRHWSPGICPELMSA